MPPREVSKEGVSWPDPMRSLTEPLPDESTEPNIMSAPSILEPTPKAPHTLLAAKMAVNVMYFVDAVEVVEVEACAAWNLRRRFCVEDVDDVGRVVEIDHLSENVPSNVIEFWLPVAFDAGADGPEVVLPATTVLFLAKKSSCNVPQSSLSCSCGSDALPGPKAQMMS